MSAFSAFGKKEVKKFCFPEPGELRKNIVSHSNVRLTTSNSIHTPNSIIVGLKHSEYLLIEGFYKLTLLRGRCLINSIHLIPQGETYTVTSDSLESIPTISVPDPTDVCEQPGRYQGVLAEFETLVEVACVKNGISEARMFDAQLMGLHIRFDQYTFRVLQPGEERTSTSILIPNDMTQALNQICESIESVAIYGVASSGKQTFAKALINCLLLSEHKAVAYLDIDPSGSNFGYPYSLSIRIHTSPVFGTFHLIHQNEYSHLQKDCYYGYSHCYEMPDFYMLQCKRLINHYKEKIQPAGIPLVVKYPSWIKGLGKEVLSTIHDYLKPKTLIYSKHENATELPGFKPLPYEVEHSDQEMLATFSCPQTKVVRGVRKMLVRTKQELRVRNTLLYFHQRGAEFDFEHFLIDRSPCKLPANVVSAVSVLNFDTDVAMSFEETRFLAEATVMGIFAFSENISSKLRGKYLNGSEFALLDPQFLGLCVVHSVSPEFFCVYVNDEQALSDEIRLALACKKKLVLARGEGQIPTVEFEAHGLSENLPYIGDTRYALGGTWEVRKNITRKTL